MIIKILLSQHPPPLPAKTKRYSKVGNSPPSPSENSKDVIEIPPPLPVKKYRHSMAVNNYWKNSPFNENYRKSLIESNSNQTNRRNSILRHNGLLKGREHSFSGSRNSLSGLSRTSSYQSLTELKNPSSLRRNGVSGSNNDVWVRRDSIFGSNSNLSPRRDSVFGSTNDLSSARNSIRGSTSDLSGRRSSLSRSRESFNGNEKNKESLDKYTKKKTGSHEIWLKVWKDCSTKCFSENYYDVYKKKALLELNLYRIKHKANILEMNPQMADFAQDLAEQYLVKRKLDVKKYGNYGILYSKVKLTLATTVLKTWYETKVKYNFFLHKPSSEAALSFTQLVWRATTQIGIGVQRDDDEFVIVYVFYPKGNRNGEYKKNVHKWIS